MRFLSVWNDKCLYAATHNELKDYMMGNGKYYWPGDKNIPGPVYPPNVVNAIYNLYENDKKSDILEIFEATLLELCKGTPSELEYSVIYFETHCRNEKVENASFYFDNKFIDLFIKTVGEICEKNEKMLRSDYPQVWRGLVVYNNALIIKTNLKRGYLKSYSAGQAWAEHAITLGQIQYMLKGIKHYSFFGIPVDVQKVLQAFYDLDRQDSFDSDSRDIFQRNLNELLEENIKDLYLAAKYFVYHLLNETENKASFRFDEEFKNNFVKKISEKCAENKNIFINEVTVYVENKWQALKELNDILINEIGFKQGFIE